MFHKLIKYTRKSPAEKMRGVRYRLSKREWYWKLHRLVSDDRTMYLVGLFGTGRKYLNDLMLANIGIRAAYFRDWIRIHPGPTSMIYSGHATVKHVSRGQALPAVTGQILEGVASGFADLVFIYRHPLDSLLTNWVWWRIRHRDRIAISGISAVYRNTDDFCADLEQNFSEFKSFADGDPAFFAGAPGPPFLSLAEFIEETEGFLQRATLSLRFEDFITDSPREFSKIVQLMSVGIDLNSLHLTPPRTKAYGYLAVKEKVPRFRAFIEELDAETKRRIEEIGYHL